MDDKLDVRERPTRVLQPQSVNDPVNERQHEADQENVCVGHQLRVVLKAAM
jgi:hypothetical protein